MARESYEQQFGKFQRDVEGHTVTVLKDDGLYRHLRCAKGGSYCMSFEVITWPGYLCYSGDMGCFVFSRLRDMFEFFRGRTDAMVDRSYLAEKAIASDKYDGIRKFSEELFAAAVRSDFETFTEDWADDQKAELWQDIEDEVLSAAGDGISAAIAAAMEFEHERQAVFSDFYEHHLEDFTGRFWWACYAIPWAIAHYDAAQRSESPVSVGAVDPHAADPGKLTTRA
jgi:hypothetical protein